MKPTVEEVARYLRANVEWHKFGRLTCALGNQLDSKQLRFLKARIFEKSVEFFSCEKLKYVAEVGCDFVVPKLNVRLEMKYSDSAIYKANGALRKTCQVILFNGMQGSTRKKPQFPPNFADFLMVVSNRGCIVFDQSVFMSDRYAQRMGDKIYGFLPIELGHIVCGPDVMVQKCEPVDFIQKFDRAVEKYCMSL